MPEPKRPVEVHGEQQATDDRAHERRVIAQPDQRPVGRPAAPVEQTGEKHHRAGDAADEEVQDDPPGPVR
jgi:hypothetical protein